MSTIGIRRGRSTQDLFTATPVWVSLSGVSAGAKALYSILLAHVNVTRGDGIAYPSQQSLADMLFMSQPSVSRFLSELVELGAVEAERARRNGANVYLVHELPPDGYAGPASLKDFYKVGKRATKVKPPANRRVCANPTVTSGNTPANNRVDSHQQMAGDPPADIHTSTDGYELDGVDLHEENNPPTPGTPGGPAPSATEPENRTRCRHRRRSCRICGTNPRAQARTAVQAARDARDATWCGSCDQRTRWRLTDDERPYQCPECHPAMTHEAAGR